MNKFMDSISKFDQIFIRLQDYENMCFEEYKYSFIIVKPNGARHISTYFNELKKWRFDILGIFAIYNHEEINLALHPTERERSHVVPINLMFKDFYGDNAILILIGKSNIEYSQFVQEVFEFKWKVRSLVEKKYISYVFDTTNILGINKGQLLKVMDSDGNEVKKYDMNHKGTFMVALPNSLHSPDNDVGGTVNELMIVYKQCIICEKNIVSDEMLKKITYYGTMEMLKDMQ